MIQVIWLTWIRSKPKKKSQGWIKYITVNEEEEINKEEEYNGERVVLDTRRKSWFFFTLLHICDIVID